MYQNDLAQKRKKPGNPGIHDRIYEVRGKLMLRKRDLEAYYTFSQKQIKDNEMEIKNLRAEIQEKRILQKQSLNADEYVIKEGFRDHRESQLAMQRYTVAKAKNEKNEHVFDAIKSLNSVKHEKQKRIRKLNELQTILESLKLAEEANNSAECNQRVRILMTSLDKMRLRCASARFIQRTYKQILHHFEQKNLMLPGRLNMMEQNLETNREELEGSLVQIQIDAKTAYDQTKTEKETMDSKIMKEKRERDRKLAEIRKKFKKINQAGQEKEYRPKKRNQNRNQMDDNKAKSSHDFWGQIRKFWVIKRAMDKLCKIMCVTQPLSIAHSFQSQINRTCELKDTITLLQNKKDNLAEQYGDLERTSDLLTKENARKRAEGTKLQDEQEYVLEDLTYRTSTVQQQYEEVLEILSNAIDAVKMICQRLSSCDWIKVHVGKLYGNKIQIAAVASKFSCDIETDVNNVVSLLSDAGDVILHIMKFVNSEIQVKEDIMGEWASDAWQNKLVSVTARAPMNTRVAIVDEEDVILAEDFFGDDDDSNDQYVSRDSIKKTMRQFTESQTAKKRRRKKKK